MNPDRGKEESSPLELATPLKGKKELKSEEISDKEISVQSKNRELNKEEFNAQSVREELINKELNVQKNLKENIRELKVQSKSERNSPVDPESQRKIITRSQLTTEHIQLEFESKKKNKMANEVGMSWEDARKYVPICKEADDVSNFIDSCEIAISTVNPKHEEYITKYIVTRIKGDVYKVIKDRDVSQWSKIKGYLTEAFERQYTASALQVELNKVRMLNGENVTNYSRRVENIYSKLCTISTIGKSESDAKVLRDNLRGLALQAYIRGLTYAIKNVVKARDPTTFEQAKQLALSEEMEIGIEQEERQNFNNNYRNGNRGNNSQNNNRNNNGNNFNNFNPNFRPNRNQNNFNNNTNNNINRSPIRCFHCNGNHFSNQCRNNNQRSNYNNNYPPNRNSNNGYNNNRPPGRNNNFARNSNFNQNNNFNRQPANFNNRNNNFTRPPANYNNANNRILTCNYCNKNGHKAEECYKKINDDRRAQAQNINYNSVNTSGNGEASGEIRGVRTIDQLSAEITDNVSILSLQ